MIEVFFGTACLVAAVGVAKGGRRCGRGRWPRRARRQGFARAAGEVLKRRLRVDHDQEDVVDHALRDLRALGTDWRDLLRDSREDLAEAFAGEEVDQGQIDALWARHDDALARSRREAVSALKQVHAVLDPDQRDRAVDLLAHGRPGWR